MAGSVQQRGKTTWRLRADGGRDPVTGRRRQLTRTVEARNLTEARKALARVVTEVGTGRHDRGTDARTLGDACRQWLEQARGGLAANTAVEYERVIASYLVPELGARPLARLSAWDLDQLYARLAERLAPASVRKVHVVASLALTQAVRWQWLTENPARHASPPKVGKPEVRPPETTEARALIETAEALDPDWATYLRVAAATGRRRGELCALRWSATDLDSPSITICRAIVIAADGPQVREHPKTPASRRQIALDPGTVASLRAHRARQAERALACGASLGADAFVWSNEPDGSRPWHPMVVTHRFARLRRRAGVPGVRLHDLRHYVATQLLAAGFDAVAVAGRLGHDPHVLHTVYAHWVPARDRDQAAYLGQLLDEGP